MYNKSKLKFIGRLPSPYNEIYVNYNSDSTISSADGENEEFIKLINKSKNSWVKGKPYNEVSLFKFKEIL